jgi:hypothetical protein
MLLESPAMAHLIAVTSLLSTLAFRLISIGLRKKFGDRFNGFLCNLLNEDGAATGKEIKICKKMALHSNKGF